MKRSDILTIIPQNGFHGKISNNFTLLCTYFVKDCNCNIYLEKEGRRVNAASILGVLSLAIVGGVEFIIIVNHSNHDTESEAYDAIIKYIDCVNRNDQDSITELLTKYKSESI